MRCGRKLGFSTVEAAERTAAVVAGLRNGTGKLPVRIYECGRCGLLHFTSKAEDETSARVTTVEHLQIEPLPFGREGLTESRPEKTKAPPASTGSCAACGVDDARFELNGRLYHRRCRQECMRALPPVERARIIRAWSDAGQLRAEARRAAKASGGGV